MKEQYVYIDPVVRDLRNLFGDAIQVTPNKKSVVEHLEQLADLLFRGYEKQDRGIKFFVDCAGLNYEDICNSGFSVDDARYCVATSHSYIDWAHAETTNAEFNVDYELLVDEMLGGNIDLLKSALGENSQLVHQKSIYPHEATLLHYTGSNGVEGYRQIVPYNLADIVESLLLGGSNLTLNAKVYGGCSALELLRTSKHPYEAGVIDNVLAIYKKYEQGVNA